MSDQTAHDVTDPAIRRAADRLLVRVAREGGAWVVVIALTTLAIAAAELALPAVLGRAVDAVVGGDGAGPWLWAIGLLVAALVACDVLDDLAAGAAIARSTAWLRHLLVDHVLAVGPRRADGLAEGEVATRLVGNAAEAGRVAPDIVRAVSVLIPAVGGTVALAVIHPLLCLTFLVGMPVFVVLLRAFARDASTSASRYLAVQGTIASRLVDALSGRRTIAASGTVDSEVRRVLEPLPELHRQGLAVWRAQMRITTQDVVLVSLLEIAVLAVAGALLARGRLSPGEMLAAGQYVLLATSIGAAITFMTRLTRSRAAAARLTELLDRPPVPYGTATLPDGGGRLQLRSVTVRRGGRTLLDRADLDLVGGSMVAVAGRSGSGKSLLAALAGRLVDPDEGEVLLDGVPLRALSRAELRRAVGFGFERPLLIGDTIGDAIAFGADHVSPAEVAAAGMAAQADGFVRRLPLGYDTPLSEAPMSGGETQRVGLARAFAHGRRLLVLDDVASSLDTATEHHISRVLAEAMGDRTRIVVAHRASTAARADVVVWIDGARVRATGSHDELWRERDYRAVFAPDEAVPSGAGAGRRDGGPA